MQTPHQTPSKSSYPQLYPHPHISLRFPIRSHHPSTYQMSKVRSSRCPSSLPLRPSVYSLTAWENLLTQRIGAQQGIWISADPVPGCVVCNIGEMWETWTNGLYKSTLHRVIHRSSNYRVSYVPFFLLNYLTGAFPVPVVGPHYTSLIYEGVVVLVVHVSLIPSSSVPFFFEPNFTACVAPLAAAVRIQAQSLSNGDGGRDEECVDTSAYPPVVYGDFLERKVAGNFSEEATAKSGKMGRY